MRIYDFWNFCRGSRERHTRNSGTFWWQGYNLRWHSAERWALGRLQWIPWRSRQNTCMEDLHVFLSLGGSRSEKAFSSSFATLHCSPGRRNRNRDLELSLGRCSFSAVQWLTVSRCEMLAQYAGCAVPFCVLSGYVVENLVYESSYMSIGDRMVALATRADCVSFFGLFRHAGQLFPTLFWTSLKGAVARQFSCKRRTKRKRQKGINNKKEYCVCRSPGMIRFMGV